MGTCCCKTKPQDPELQHDDQNKLHKTIEISTPPPKPSQSEEIGLKTINTDCKDEESDSITTRELRADTEHWRAQTFVILGDLPHDLQGSDFENDDDDSKYNDEPFSPKKLINSRPRKSYVSKYEKYMDEEFALEPGSTLNATNSWAPCKASQFNLRSIEYVKNKRNGLKASGNALYELMAADCFEVDHEEGVTNQDIDEMIRCLNIQQNGSNAYSPFPNIMIISLRVPFYEKKQRKGVHLLFYAKICKDFGQKYMNDPSATLLEKLLNLEQEQLDSFKMTLKIPNVKETTLGTMTKKLVKTLNGKSMAFKKHAHFGYVNNGMKNVFVVKFDGYGLNSR